MTLDDRLALVRDLIARRDAIDAELDAVAGAFMGSRPSVMGQVMSSRPDNRHAAQLALLSVVDAGAATLCCQRER